MNRPNQTFSMSMPRKEFSTFLEIKKKKKKIHNQVKVDVLQIYLSPHATNICWKVRVQNRL